MFISFLKAWTKPDLKKKDKRTNMKTLYDAKTTKQNKNQKTKTKNNKKVS